KARQPVSDVRQPTADESTLCRGRVRARARGSAKRASEGASAAGNSRTSAGSRVIGMSANDVWARSHRFVPHHALGARVDFQRLEVERAELRDCPEYIAALREETVRRRA